MWGKKTELLTEPLAKTAREQEQNLTSNNYQEHETAQNVNISHQEQ